ncbi:MAG TPA: tetratricopeptide repeat protein, partial [Pyrinomonadaceae bacterium]|nr:tetratricopeptide repeat protein [Pyrinomonadaceae bacterium]
LKTVLTANCQLPTAYCIMTKDNILFSIIGVLVGVIVGYVFATTVNQHGYTARTSSSSSAQLTQDSRLHGNQPESADNNLIAQGGGPNDTVLVEQAKAQPSDFEAQMKAAGALYQARHFDEAIDFFTRANKLRPDSYEAIVALGDTNFDAGHYEIAEKWYTAALEKKPDDVNVRTDLGLTFLFRDPMDVDRAIKEFRRSLQIDPNHEQTLQDITVALTKKGSFDEADATLKKLAEVNPSNPGLAKLRAELDAARANGKSSDTSKRK